MAYLGPKPSQTLATPTSQYFNGTGSQTVFTLNRAVNVSEDLEVFVNNIQQEPGVGKSYTASGTTLTFDAAPSSGTANVYVVYRGLAEVTTRLEHDANSALAATTGTFSGSVTADGVHSEYNGVSDNMTTSPTASGVQIGSFTNGYSAVEIAGTSGGFIDFSSADGTDFDGRILYAHSDDSMRFYTSGTTERVRIDSSGNVGIGGSPNGTLHVRGSSAKIILEGTNNSGNTEHYLGTSGSSEQDFVIQAGSDTLLINSDYILFRNTAGSSEHMRIDSSGNVGIGTPSPTKTLDINTASATFRIRNASGGNDFAFKTTAGPVSVIGCEANTSLALMTNNTERLRINANGNVGIGVAPSSGFKFISNSSGTSGLWAGYFHGRDYAKASRLDTSGYADFFYTPTGYAGYIYVDTATNTTTYASSSDYRLKTEVTYEWDATSRLKQLKPARFKWISAGDESVPVDGFLAHEVSHDSDGNPLVPEAIVGEKDAMRDEKYEVTPAVLDEDGNEVTPAVMGTRSVPDYQGIDQAKLVPLLVKTIQELEARIAALEVN